MTLHDEETREPPLSGARVLVIQSDPFVAAHLDLMVDEAGGEVVAIAGSPEDALKVLDQEQIDAAIIDPRLGEDGEAVFVLEEELKRRGIPFVLYDHTVTHDALLPASALAT